jgi:hypothetical protein
MKNIKNLFLVILFFLATGCVGAETEGAVLDSASVNPGGVEITPCPT